MGIRYIVSTFLKNQILNKRLRKIARILINPNAPDTRRAEKDFQWLQERYAKQPLPNGESETLRNWKLACRRAVQILSQPEMLVPHKILELGCGEGTVGFLLTKGGHNVTLTDGTDWRASMVQDLPFILADICNPNECLSLGGEYDLIYSYNAMEHFYNPVKVFDNVIPRLKTGGLVFLQFGPLYASCEGLHAFCLNMPYPQFLFSELFVKDIVHKLTVHDLCKNMDTLQPVNQWRYKQYESLWKRSDLEMISVYREKNFRHLDIIEKYPECFSGRNLTVEDVTTEAYEIVLRKK